MAKVSEFCTLSDLKKKIGTLIIETNANILELQDGLKRVQSGGDFSKQEKEREAVLLKQKNSLDEVATALRNNAQNKEDGQIEKYLKLIDTTIETSVSVLNKDKSSELDTEKIKDTKKKRLKNCYQLTKLNKYLS